MRLYFLSLSPIRITIIYSMVDKEKKLVNKLDYVNIAYTTHIYEGADGVDDYL